MSCVTCGHSMQGSNATVFDNPTIFHCPRCGTMKNRDGSFAVPKLVERCRLFITGVSTEGASYSASEIRKYWIADGIAESINKPEDRK